MQLLTLRLHDLAKLFHHRYRGPELPDDDAGRDDLWIALNHLACLPHPRAACMAWVEKWAPWMPLAEASETASRAMVNPTRYKADALAWKLKITKEERRMLGITTIGAVGENKGMRTKRRKEQDRQRKINQRRSAGAKPRDQYEQQSASRAKPWELEGISRATWYRRKREIETSPATA